jgi:hypothetical protein
MRLTRPEIRTEKESKLTWKIFLESALYGKRRDDGQVYEVK